MRSLDRRVAVVTGAGSGIGAALANRFAMEGMKLVLADIEAAALAETVARARAAGAEAIGVATDVTRAEEVDGLAERALHEFGAVHVVCNNAGVLSGLPFAEIPTATWEWVMGVDFWGVLHGCQTFLPILRRQGEGHIVNTSSMAAFATGLPTMAPYAAAKFATLALSESLEHELRTGGEPVRVSVLVPPAVRTRMAESERNRPDGVRATADHPASAAILALLRDTSDAVGVEPAEVADAVADGIRENRFWILPSGVGSEVVAALQERIDSVRHGQLASGGLPVLASGGSP
jgi:NAD(P)-dependent dehydrogenase (short-subunit alcohol dehydrogenase family)